MKAKLEKVEHSFPACYERDSEILLLGSIPSVKSREVGFYYMHPQNRFWRVVSAVYQEEVPTSIEGMKLFLKRHKIALWDVLASCRIQGSKDSTICDSVPNDILGLLEQTEVKRIYTTGRKAYDLYQKYCYPKTKREAKVLPSTSPLNCACSFDSLVSSYQAALNPGKEDFD